MGKQRKEKKKESKKSINEIQIDKGLDIFDSHRFLGRVCYV